MTSFHEIIASLASFYRCERLVNLPGFPQLILRRFRIQLQQCRPWHRLSPVLAPLTMCHLLDSFIKSLIKHHHSTQQQGVRAEPTAGAKREPGGGVRARVTEQLQVSSKSLQQA